jgi:hypothetical protein
MILAALFVYLVGQQELAAVRRQASWRGHGPLEMRPIDEQHPDETAAAGPVGFSGFTWDAAARCWIVWRNGRPTHSIPVE